MKNVSAIQSYKIPLVGELTTGSKGQSSFRTKLVYHEVVWDRPTAFLSGAEAAIHGWSEVHLYTVFTGNAPISFHDEDFSCLQYSFQPPEAAQSFSLDL